MARESLREMFERVVLRWHFHMLNDFVRNSSYSRVISNAISRIPDCSVLDIGSGTGLLRHIIYYNAVIFTREIERYFISALFSPLAC